MSQQGSYQHFQARSLVSSGGESNGFQYQTHPPRRIQPLRPVVRTVSREEDLPSNDATRRISNPGQRSTGNNRSSSRQRRYKSPKNVDTRHTPKEHPSASSSGTEQRYLHGGSEDGMRCEEVRGVRQEQHHSSGLHPLAFKSNPPNTREEGLYLTHDGDYHSGGQDYRNHGATSSKAFPANSRDENMYSFRGGTRQACIRRGGNEVGNSGSLRHISPSRLPKSTLVQSLSGSPRQPEERNLHGIGIYTIEDEKAKEKEMRTRQLEQRPSSSTTKRAPTYDHQSAPMILVAPGLSVQLRGSKESLYAMQTNFFDANECFCCQANVLCIQDAKYLICPDCRSFSPAVAVDDPRAFGIGLGFKWDDVVFHREECAETRTPRRPWD